MSHIPLTRIFQEEVPYKNSEEHKILVTPKIDYKKIAEAQKRIELLERSIFQNKPKLENIKTEESKEKIDKMYANVRENKERLADRRNLWENRIIEKIKRKGKKKFKKTT